MPWRIAEFLIGLAVAGVALSDVFSSVIAPGRAGGGVRLAGRLSRVMYPAIRVLVRRRRGDRAQDFLGGGAAFLLLAMLVLWVAALLVGFTLMAHALRDDFDPPVDLPEAAFQAGIAMMTLGISGHTAEGWVRPVMFMAGFTGLAVVTLTLTFIVAVQQALDKREAVVLAFGHLGGERPNGLDLLLTVAELGLEPKLDSHFQRWAAWCADVTYSHTAHPVLAYFRSRDRRNDWLATLGAMLDCGALTLALLREAPRGEAQLMLRAGERLAIELCRLYDLEPPSPQPVTAGDVARACAKLQAVGYATGAQGAALETLASLRGRYAGQLAALTDYFSVKPPEWLAPVAVETPAQRV